MEDENDSASEGEGLEDEMYSKPLSKRARMNPERAAAEKNQNELTGDFANDSGQP